MGINSAMSWPTADRDTACASAMWAGDVPTPFRKCLQRSSLAVEHLSGARVFKTGPQTPAAVPVTEAELFGPEEETS